MNEQITLFDMTRKPYQINKPIRLIELFAGYGSTAMALRNIGADFEHYRVVEFDKYAIASYNAIHGTDFPAIDIKDVKGEELGIIEKDKYCYLMTYSFPCFTEDALVLTSCGLKRIKDVETGDYVLSHDNKYHKVIRSEQTGIKNIYQIKAMGVHEIKCTINHKFYVRKRTRYYPRYENGKRGNCRRFENPEWVELKDITKDHYLGIAINQNSIIPAFIKEEWRTNHSFWYVIGRFVGDGWTDKKYVCICGNEKKIIELITHLENLNLKYRVHQERTCQKAYISSKDLRRICDMFGKYATGKYIPAFMFDMPDQYLKSFINGYFASDGCFKDRRYHISSVNETLIYGTAQLIAKAYKQPYSIYKTKRKPTCIIEGRTVNQRDSWEVVWKMDKKKQDNSFYEDGYIWVQIQSITDLEHEEPVYDLTVEDSHSFTANGIIVHNCTDISIAGRQAGFEENSGTRSSLLWEVKRILNELKESGSLPDVLLMENVIAIHHDKNVRHFRSWIDFLDSLGYSNYVEDLNAADYGIPQHRERTFMVSILGEYNYKFPHPIELTTCLEDYFEDLTEEEAMKQIVKSSKAMDLLVKLDEENKLD